MWDRDKGTGTMGQPQKRLNLTNTGQQIHPHDTNSQARPNAPQNRVYNFLLGEMANEKRRVGRPSKGFRRTVMLKVPPPDHAKIKAYAKSHKIDMNALMIQATLRVVEGQMQLELK